MKEVKEGVGTQGLSCGQEERMFRQSVGTAEEESMDVKADTDFHISGLKLSIATIRPIFSTFEFHDFYARKDKI